MAQDPNQGQLFDPGPKGPNRWRLHPDNWVQRKDVVYHATDATQLPRTDRGGNVDVGYGDSVGMHFGDKATAVERGLLARRQFVHTARLDAPMAPKMSDQDANYSDEAGRAVRAGKVVPYVNSYENPGSVSFRVKPEGTKTWAQDVQADPNAHPALKHLAEKGYNPTISPNVVARQHEDDVMIGHSQRELFNADVQVAGKTVSVHVDEDDAWVDAGKRRASGQNALIKRNNIKRVSLKDTANSARPRLRRVDSDPNFDNKLNLYGD